MEVKCGIAKKAESEIDRYHCLYRLNRLRCVRELSLKDCIVYMQVCTVAHDVVYYVFAH